MIRITSKKLYSLLLAIAGLILCTGIVYAALSTNLSVSGTTTIFGGGWDLSLKSYGNNFSVTKTGRATYTTPTISGTSLVDYTVGLMMPGDSVSFYFTVVNNGSISAVINNFSNADPVCTSSTGNEADAKLVCDNLSISVSTVESTMIMPGSVIYNKSSCSYQYPNEMSFKVTIYLNEQMTSVPSSNVTISNGDVSVLLGQSEKYASCGGGSND